MENRSSIMSQLNNFKYSVNQNILKVILKKTPNTCVILDYQHLCWPHNPKWTLKKIYTRKLDTKIVFTQKEMFLIVALPSDKRGRWLQERLTSHGGQPDTRAQQRSHEGQVRSTKVRSRHPKSLFVAGTGFSGELYWNLITWLLHPFLHLTRTSFVERKQS